MRPPGKPVDSASIQALAYLNLSSGSPDPNFQRNLNCLFGEASEGSGAPCWKGVHRRLAETLAAGCDSPALKSAEQVEAVLPLVFERVLPEYLEHHGDLLFHQNEEALFNSFFVARACEAVLSCQGPWEETGRIVRQTIFMLNDYLGHRPVAVLENDRKAEPYKHERVRPVPIYLRGVGAAAGRYQQVVDATLEILHAADPALLEDAYFDPELMDELAFDPRAYDFGHPANRRPNYQFGEWDPHVIDNSGRFRRFIVRQVTLDALMERLNDSSIPPDEVLREAAAVLAGVILMASGTSGRGPDTHDSSTTLPALLARIASYRDRFYIQLLNQLPEAHRQRLEAEAQRTRQPFGGARQHLNRYLARLRAAQLQHVELANLYAEMGYPKASRQQAQIVPAARGRMRAEIASRVTTCHRLLDSGRVQEAAALLPEMEDLLHRAIECGAFVDPWNILGFQAQYSVFISLENSVPDTRVDELLDMMHEQFSLYVRLSSEAAATGNKDLELSLADGVERLATWWDQFATSEVSGIRRVVGREAANSARNVAQALGAWHEAGAAAGDVAFWQQHVDRFKSPKSYALVTEALLEKHDFVASMALLVQWLSQAHSVRLQEGRFSLHTLALRWLQGGGIDGRPPPHPWNRVRKFFDYLEANADEYWNVPQLEHITGKRTEPAADPWDFAGNEESDDEDNPFASAYEDVTYRDSTSDGHDADMLSGQSEITDDELVLQNEEFSSRLRFLSTVATLWRNAAARYHNPECQDEDAGERSDTLKQWFRQSCRNAQALIQLLESVARRQPSKLLSGEAGLVEYDRFRRFNDALAYEVLLTYVATARAQLGVLAALPAADCCESDLQLDTWQEKFVALQRQIISGNVDRVRELIPDTFAELRQQPLLYVPMSRHGDPCHHARAQLLQQVLRDLLRALPRMGLLRETFHLLETVREMERHPPAMPKSGVSARPVSDFARLFQIGLQAIVENLIESTRNWPAPGNADEAAANLDAELIEVLQRVTEPLLRHQWLPHSRSLQLSVLEKVPEQRWKALVQFIESYGKELFTQQFFHPGNIRSILHQGVAKYLQDLIASEESELQLIADLEAERVDLATAASLLELALESVMENYSEYCDYNTTTTQSDSGDNLYMLLDFLRLKISYDRMAWHLKPMVLAHEVLVRQRRSGAAELWRQVMAEHTQAIADTHLGKLAELEARYSMHLSTVADRLRERLIQPLALDRVKALIGPAMSEAVGDDYHPSFDVLEQEIREFTEQPAGVGLDVPDWIEALEEEVQNCRNPVPNDSLSTQWLPQVRVISISREELAKQLARWEKPLDAEAELDSEEDDAA